MDRWIDEWVNGWIVYVRPAGRLFSTVDNVARGHPLTPNLRGLTYSPLASLADSVVGKDNKCYR